MAQFETMLRSVIRRFATPGRVPESAVLIVSFVLICGICWLDIELGADIRLRILYVFPVAAIALHSERLRNVIFGLVLTVVCEIVSLLKYDSAKVIDGLAGFAGLLLVAVLARSARGLYLETLALATYDPLTRLRNRHSFETIVELEIARQRRYGGVFSLAVIDLDGFKDLNDSQGHHAGDRALLLLADVLRERTGQWDSIARIGGDEFAILMPMTENADGSVPWEHLCETIAGRMEDEGFSITASIGHATFERAPESVSEALQKADRAMYSAKSNGKGHAVSV